MTSAEVAGDWPTHPYRRGEEDADSRGIPNPNQTALDKGRRESAKENPQENQEQGKC